jgi:LmbE family N-acetylglucosaminyl deacetylase
VALVNVEAAHRLDEAVSAVSGLPGPVTLDVCGSWPSGMDLVPVRAVADFLTPLLDRYQPVAVAFPDLGATHQDHRKSAEAGVVVTRPTGGTGRWRPPVVLSYEETADVWPPRATFLPQFTSMLDEADLAFKMAAMEAHASQVRCWPSERSGEAIRALAEVRGAQAGVMYGEAYGVLRWLV